jgi:hypothetical protein
MVGDARVDHRDRHGDRRAGPVRAHGRVAIHLDPVDAGGQGLGRDRLEGLRFHAQDPRVAGDRRGCSVGEAGGVPAEGEPVDPGHLGVMGTSVVLRDRCGIDIREDHEVRARNDRAGRRDRGTVTVAGNRRYGGADVARKGTEQDGDRDQRQHDATHGGLRSRT